MDGESAELLDEHRYRPASMIVLYQLL